MATSTVPSRASIARPTARFSTQNRIAGQENVAACQEPLEIGEKIITNSLRVEPIFSLLERKYGVPLIEAEYKLDAVAAETEVAPALRVWPGLAVGKSSPPAAYAFMTQQG